ncbi:LPXTG cell wall anchor domain-containing protein [Streptomyces sp. NPDC059766]|uniref:LPXTG cell wall anchor domain-containing protein n=1 Tax=Streptomyces sp. NPDC059766 TaxID=3346940 RepID=UPI0036651AEB
MKIRRAPAAATAAAAAILPLALLTAPVALADASTSTPAPGYSTPAADGTTPAPGRTGHADSNGTGDVPDQLSGTGTPSGTANATGTPSSSPSKEPESCPGNDGVDPASQLSTSLSGLPGSIAAGSGWHNFTLSATNHSAEGLGTVIWGVYVNDNEMSDPGRDRLEYHALVQYFDPQTGSWKSPDAQEGMGFYAGRTELGPRQTAVMKLRVNIDAGAPLVDGRAETSGGYTDAEKNCRHFNYSIDEFTVLGPGSGTESPGESKPSEDPKPADGQQPQSGADETPATGDLAATGSGSALPVIGLIGGVAVVTGAAALFTVRRRKDAQA